MKNLIFAVLLYLLAHEGGHFFMALILGCKPRPKLNGWRPYVSFVWDKHWKYRLIMEAGFGGGMLAGLWLIYLLGTEGTWVDKPFLFLFWLALAAHFWLYSWFAPDATNDFNGMCSHVKENGDAKN